MRVDRKWLRITLFTYHIIFMRVLLLLIEIAALRSVGNCPPCQSERLRSGIAMQTVIVHSCPSGSVVVRFSMAHITVRLC